jgi:predicted methyltransferase
MADWLTRASRMFRMARMTRHPVVSLAALVFLGCGHSTPHPDAPHAEAAHADAPIGAATTTIHVDHPAVPPTIAAVVAADDRTSDDRKLDDGRHPAEMLAFFGIGPGMKVAELQAAAGYTTELVARAVGPTGTVYGQNNKWVLEKFAEAGWSARLAKPVNARVVRVDRELEDPLPPEAKELDAVLMVLFYHDTVRLKVDRPKMNAAVFGALKRGGVYGIVDHSGREGSGGGEAETLHRIEEKVVRSEVEATGFRLQADASFLRNPGDTRDWSASPRTAGEKRGTSDRFVLKFVKP